MTNHNLAVQRTAFLFCDNDQGSFDLFRFVCCMFSSFLRSWLVVTTSAYTVQP